MTESDRQKFYTEQLRALVAEKEATLGRRLTFCVVTFGCQMNARDSEKLTGILTEAGYKETDTEQADFVLYNTCTVRENANERLYGRLGHLNHYKKSHPETVIAVCGCMMQEPAEVEHVRNKLTFVDIVFGTHNIFKLAELLHRHLTTGERVFDVWEDTDMIVEDLPSKRKYSFKSGVNIMFGCNNFCSYCIVPYVRGRERSRKPEDIISEIRSLADDGVVEIMLLGQNVNSYGKNLENPMTFAALLREIEKIDGIRRIRFMTSHPKDLSDELIETMAASKKICRHLHLPLQSGSSRVLKAMNRHYTKEQYLALVERIRAAIPDISLTTDIIVGFPGETDEDFSETIDVIKEVSFDNAFTFIYSKRDGTAAAKLPQVPEDVVKRRFDTLLRTVQEIASSVCNRDLGEVLEVLVEETDSKEPGMLTGRLSNNIMVHFKGNPELVSRIVKVRLIESKGFYYYGRLEE